MALLISFRLSPGSGNIRHVIEIDNEYYHPLPAVFGGTLTKLTEGTNLSNRVHSLQTEEITEVREIQVQPVRAYMLSD